MTSTSCCQKRIQDIFQSDPNSSPSHLHTLDPLCVLPYKTRTKQRSAKRTFFFLFLLNYWSIGFCFTIYSNWCGDPLVNRRLETDTPLLKLHQIFGKLEEPGSLVRRIWDLGTARTSTVTWDLRSKILPCAIFDPNFSTSFFPLHFLGYKYKWTVVQRQVGYAWNLLHHVFPHS